MIRRLFSLVYACHANIIYGTMCACGPPAHGRRQGSRLASATNARGLSSVVSHNPVPGGVCFLVPKGLILPARIWSEISEICSGHLDGAQHVWSIRVQQVCVLGEHSEGCAHHAEGTKSDDFHFVKSLCWWEGTSLSSYRTAWLYHSENGLCVRLCLHLYVRAGVNTAARK